MIDAVGARVLEYSREGLKDYSMYGGNTRTGINGECCGYSLWGVLRNKCQI